MESEIILHHTSTEVLHELCHIFDIKIFFEDEQGGRKAEAYLIH